MGLCFAGISLLLLLRHKSLWLPFSLISAFFFTFAFTYALALRPAYFIWMGFATIIGWVNTRLILIILFYLVFSPFGLVMKLFRHDPLSRNTEKEKESYWLDNQEINLNPSNYKRQF